MVSGAEGLGICWQGYGPVYTGEAWSSRNVEEGPGARSVTGERWHLGGGEYVWGHSGWHDGVVRGPQGLRLPQPHRGASFWKNLEGLPQTAHSTEGNKNIVKARTRGGLTLS